MIDIIKAKQYCKDDIAKIENYDKAVNDKTLTWHCHHRLETSDTVRARPSRYLKMCDMYFHRPASELIFLTPSEHRRIHHEYNQLHRKIHVEKKCKHHSEETKRKISETMKRRNAAIKKENLS